MTANSGTADKIILGAGGITNNFGNITGSPTVPVTPSANQIRCLIELTNNATIWNCDLSQELTIRQFDATAGNKCLDQMYVLQAATSLVPSLAWAAIATNRAGTNGVFGFIDPQASNFNQRFYRVSTLGSLN